jgi:sortase (surface protein transpeptidase)
VGVRARHAKGQLPSKVVTGAFLVGALVSGVLWWAWPNPGSAPLPRAKEAHALSAAKLEALGPASLPRKSRGATSSAAVAPLVPDEVDIPSLGVTAPLIAEPLVNGYLTIPADVHHVGWYTGGGALGGSVGTLLLAGHVNFVNQGPGAFAHLADVQRGATVFTTDGAGVIEAWRVTAVTAVLKTDLPQGIFDASGPRRLVLVTCGGTLEPDHLYNENVVVYATPVALSEKGGVGG